ncbi:MAG: hypothetical protein COB49_10985 [Alphaproteobacteria bacterium]|nr:MAG: hypothetical protein COB49_10985 [Alphaproteobacteria bacterium]
MRRTKQSNAKTGLIRRATIAPSLTKVESIQLEQEAASSHKCTLNPITVHRALYKYIHTDFWGRSERSPYNQLQWTGLEKIDMASGKKQIPKRGPYEIVLAQSNKRAAQEYAESLRPIIIETMLPARSGKGMGPKALAAALNAKGIPTARDAQWHPETVRRVLMRLGPSLKQEFKEAWLEDSLRKMVAQIKEDFPLNVKR